VWRLVFSASRHTLMRAKLVALVMCRDRFGKRLSLKAIIRAQCSRDVYPVRLRNSVLIIRFDFSVPIRGAGSRQACEFDCDGKVSVSVCSHVSRLKAIGPLLPVYGLLTDSTVIVRVTSVPAWVSNLHDATQNLRRVLFVSQNEEKTPNTPRDLDAHLRSFRTLRRVLKCSRLAGIEPVNR
jgi:hypothetical protein